MSAINIKERSFVTKSLYLISICMIMIYIYISCYDKPYKSVALLPIAYFISNSFYSIKIKKNNTYKGGFIYKVSLIVIFIRYVVTPLSIALTKNFYYNDVYTSKSSINLAVILMIFELICVYISLYIFCNLFSKRYRKDITVKVEMPKHKFIFIIFIIFGTIAVILVEPNLIIPNNFLVLSKDFQKVHLELAYDGIYSTLANTVKPIIFLVLFSMLKEKYDLHNRKIYIVLSFVLVIVLMSMYTGTERWEIIFAGIIGLYILVISFNKIPKSLIIVTVVIMLISFISVSLYKFSWTVQNSKNPVFDVIIEMSGMFQDYFSGPRGVANSIEMYKIYRRDIGLFTFINDFIGSIPIIAGFVNQSDRINVYYNLYNSISNNTLNIPMIGIGYSYFTVFPPIFTVICQYFIVKIDYKIKISKSIEYKYLYLYLGLFLSMCQGFNTQIIFAKFLIPFLPLLLIYKINDRVCIKKVENYKNMHIVDEGL